MVPVLVNVFLVCASAAMLAVTGMVVLGVVREATDWKR